MLIKCLLNLQETVVQKCNPEKIHNWYLIGSLVKLSEVQNHNIIISKAMVTSTNPYNINLTKLNKVKLLILT